MARIRLVKIWRFTVRLLFVLVSLSHAWSARATEAEDEDIAEAESAENEIEIAQKPQKRSPKAVIPTAEFMVFVAASWVSNLKTSTANLSDQETSASSSISAQPSLAFELIAKRLIGIRAEAEYYKFYISRPLQTNEQNPPIGFMRSYVASVGPILYLLKKRRLAENQNVFGGRFGAFWARSRFRYLLEPGSGENLAPSAGYWMSGVGARAGFVVRGIHSTVSMLEVGYAWFAHKNIDHSKAFVPESLFTITAIEIGFSL